MSIEKPTDIPLKDNSSELADVFRDQERQELEGLEKINKLGVESAEVSSGIARLSLEDPEKRKKVEELLEEEKKQSDGAV